MEQQRAEDSQGRDAAAAPTPVAPSGSGEADAAAAAAPSLTTEDDQAAAKAKAAAARERGGAAFRRGEFKAAAEAYYEAAKHEPLVHTHFSNLALALLKLEARYGEIWGDRMSSSARLGRDVARYGEMVISECTPLPPPRDGEREISARAAVDAGGKDSRLLSATLGSSRVLSGSSRVSSPVPQRTQLYVASASASSARSSSSVGSGLRCTSGSTARA